MTATLNLKQQLDAFCEALGAAEQQVPDGYYIAQRSELKHTISLSFQHLIGVQMRHADWKIVVGLGTDDFNAFIGNLADYLYNDIIKGDDDAKLDDVAKAIRLIADHVHTMVEQGVECPLEEFNDCFMCPENPEEEIAGLAERAEMDVGSFKTALGVDAYSGSESDFGEPHGMGSAPTNKGRRLNDRYEVRVDGEKVEGSSRIDHATNKYNKAVEKYKGLNVNANITLFDLKDGVCLEDSDEDDGPGDIPPGTNSLL